MPTSCKLAGAGDSWDFFNKSVSPTGYFLGWGFLGWGWDDRKGGRAIKFQTCGSGGSYKLYLGSGASALQTRTRVDGGDLRIPYREMGFLGFIQQMRKPYGLFFWLVVFSAGVVMTGKGGRAHKLQTCGSGGGIVWGCGFLRWG